MSGMSGMSSRMDPIKVTLGVLVLILAGVAGYLGYKYNSQCAGTNGVSCTGTGVHLEEGGICTADVKSCGSGTADENGVCQFSASSGSSGSSGSGGLGQTNIILIAVAGVLLLVGGGIALARGTVSKVRRDLGVPSNRFIDEHMGDTPHTGWTRAASGIEQAGSKFRGGLNSLRSRVGSVVSRRKGYAV